MPSVTVLDSPRGAPTASTVWPTASFSLSAKVAGTRSGALHLDDGEVARRVGADDAGGHGGAVGEGHADRPAGHGGRDDVVVGDDVAVLAQDDARAGARDLLRPAELPGLRPGHRDGDDARRDRRGRGLRAAGDGLGGSARAAALDGGRAGRDARGVVALQGVHDAAADRSGREAREHETGRARGARGAGSRRPRRRCRPAAAPAPGPAPRTGPHCWAPSRSRRRCGCRRTRECCRTAGRTPDPRGPQGCSSRVLARLCAACRHRASCPWEARVHTLGAGCEQSGRLSRRSACRP